MINYNELPPSEKLFFLKNMLETYKEANIFYSDYAKDLDKENKLYTEETYMIMTKIENLKAEIDANFHDEEDEE